MKHMTGIIYFEQRRSLYLTTVFEFPKTYISKYTHGISNLWWHHATDRIVHTHNDSKNSTVSIGSYIGPVPKNLVKSNVGKKDARITLYLDWGLDKYNEHFMVTFSLICSDTFGWKRNAKRLKDFLKTENIHSLNFEDFKVTNEVYLRKCLKGHYKAVMKECAHICAKNTGIVEYDDSLNIINGADDSGTIPKVITRMSPVSFPVFKVDMSEKQKYISDVFSIILKRINWSMRSMTAHEALVTQALLGHLWRQAIFVFDELTDRSNAFSAEVYATKYLPKHVKKAIKDLGVKTNLRVYDHDHLDTITYCYEYVMCGGQPPIRRRLNEDMYNGDPFMPNTTLDEKTVEDVSRDISRKMLEVPHQIMQGGGILKIVENSKRSSIHNFFN